MIKIITYPDVVHDNSKKILLISPGKEIESLFQNDFLPKVDEHLQVYYASFSDDTDNIKWFMNVFSMCDTVIINLDNVSQEYYYLMGYLLAFPKTYYLTNNNSLVYNIMNANRIYNLDFLLEKYRTTEE